MSDEAGLETEGKAAYERHALEIYRESYSALYPGLYIEPWRKKHQLNATNLGRLLALLPERPSWLDLACGPAWHFGRFPGRARMVGLDLSPAQLRRARQNAPHAELVRADMARAPFAAARFDLVTQFWAAYGYLGSFERIAAVLSDALGWIRPGGALYLEVLLARDLESFNRSVFSGSTGFKVAPLSSDYSAWAYEDVGGRHLMLSPPLEFFLDLLAPGFEHLEAVHDSGFMVHLVATRRKP